MKNLLKKSKKPAKKRVSRLKKQELSLEEQEKQENEEFVEALNRGIRKSIETGEEAETSRILRIFGKE